MDLLSGYGSIDEDDVPKRVGVTPSVSTPTSILINSAPAVSEALTVRRQYAWHL